MGVTIQESRVAGSDLDLPSLTGARMTWNSDFFFFEEGRVILGQTSSE
jgi:hypothetical protein